MLLSHSVFSYHTKRDENPEKEMTMIDIFNGSDVGKRLLNDYKLEFHQVKHMTWGVVGCVH